MVSRIQDRLPLLPYARQVKQPYTTSEELLRVKQANVEECRGARIAKSWQRKRDEGLQHVQGTFSVESPCKF